MATHLDSLFSSEVVAGLNHLLVDVLKSEEDEPEKVLFIRTFLSRYISRGRPLSGYFIVCCVIEAQWTILAQALIPRSASPSKIPDFVEAAAANKAWQNLLHERIDDSIDGDEQYRKALSVTIDCAMKCFSNLLVQIEEMESEPSEDSYAWETMSESLVSSDSHLCYTRTDGRLRNWPQYALLPHALLTSSYIPEYNFFSAKILPCQTTSCRKLP